MSSRLAVGDRADVVLGSEWHIGTVTARDGTMVTLRVEVLPGPQVYTVERAVYDDSSLAQVRASKRGNWGGGVLPPRDRAARMRRRLMQLGTHTSCVSDPLAALPRPTATPTADTRTAASSGGIPAAPQGSPFPGDGSAAVASFVAEADTFVSGAMARADRVRAGVTVACTVDGRR